MKHMSETPRPHRVRWAALGAAIAVALGGGTIATVNAVQESGERLTYSAITPCRLADTRPGTNNIGPREGALGAGETVTFAARGDQGKCTAADLGSDTAALALNITALGASNQTFLTIWPDGAQPVAASLNPAPGQPPVPNAVTTSLSAAGAFNIYNDTGNVHVVIDVVGIHTDHNHDDRYDTSEEVDAKIDAVELTPGPQGDTGAKGDTGSTGDTGATGRTFGRMITTQRSLNPAMAIGGKANDITIDAFGHPVVSFQGPADDLYVATCADTTCGQVDIELIDSAGAVGFDNSIAIGANGSPIMVYTDTTNNQMKLAQCAERDCSIGLAAGTTVTPFLFNAEQGALAIAPDGNPFVAARSISGTALAVVACTTPNCATNVQTSVDAADDAGRFPAVTFGADGKPIISYIGGPTGAPTLNVAVCGDPLCALSVIRTVGPATSARTTIAIDPSGNPTIAFENGIPSIARCDDPTCASSTVTAVAGAVATDDNVSMAIGADGMPVLSWYNSAGQELEVALCLTASCSDADVTVVERATSDYGLHSAVAIGAHGTPLVALSDIGQAENLLAAISRTSFTADGWPS